MSDCGELLIGQLEFYWGGDRPPALIAHINREVMHHGAEICLLRDLYRAGMVTR